jgi:hypothetical protein
MGKPLLGLILLCAACSSQDNIIAGGIAGGATTPDVLFDNIGSSIHGVATPRDSAGNPVGDPLATVIMSDVPNLCDRLKAHPDYFRNAPEAYEALIMTVRLGYLGTFIVGRDSDPGTSAEIVAASGPQVTTPFHAVTSSYIAVTTWPTGGGGNATGSFYLLMDDPYGTGVAHPFSGRFKTDLCATLEGVLLP